MLLSFLFGIYYLGFYAELLFIEIIILFRPNVILDVCLLILAYIKCIFINDFIEWGFRFTSPPKPHAFVSLPVENSMSLSLDISIITQEVIDLFVNQWLNVLICFTIKGIDIALTIVSTTTFTANNIITDSIDISGSSFQFIPHFNPWADIYRLYFWVKYHVFYLIPLVLPVLQSTFKGIHKIKFTIYGPEIFADYKKILYYNWYRVYLFYYYYVFEGGLSYTGINLMHILSNIHQELYNRWYNSQYYKLMWVIGNRNYPNRDLRLSPTLIFGIPENIPHGDPLLHWFMINMVYISQMIWCLWEVITNIKDYIIRYVSLLNIDPDQRNIILDMIIEIMDTMNARNLTDNSWSRETVTMVGASNLYFEYVTTDSQGLFSFIRDLFNYLNLDHTLVEEFLFELFYFFNLLLG